jgi:hypothetical protein
MAFLSFKWLLPVLFSVLHPFYISVTEINHNAKEKSVEISCKMFAEDIEDALKQNYKQPVDLSSEKQHVQNDKFLSDYIYHHLSIAVDGKPVKPAYVGFEKQSEAIYCYFEITNIPAVKRFDITNTILQDFTDKQINIVHVTVNGNRKSSKLDYPEKQVAFSF